MAGITDSCSPVSQQCVREVNTPTDSSSVQSKAKKKKKSGTKKPCGTEPQQKPAEEKQGDEELVRVSRIPLNESSWLPFNRVKWSVLYLIVTLSFRVQKTSWTGSLTGVSSSWNLGWRPRREHQSKVSVTLPSRLIHRSRPQRVLRPLCPRNISLYPRKKPKTTHF